MTFSAEAAEPCQCHTSWAYITNLHDGHCCFFPAVQDCHQAEVAEWERQRDLRRSQREEVSA